MVKLVERIFGYKRVGQPPTSQEAFVASTTNVIRRKLQLAEDAFRSAEKASTTKDKSYQALLRNARSAHKNADALFSVTVNNKWARVADLAQKISVQVEIYLESEKDERPMRTRVEALFKNLHDVL